MHQKNCTPLVWCHVVRSRDVHPCCLVSRCPVSRCQSPQFWWSRDVRSRDFSRPALRRSAGNDSYIVGRLSPALASATCEFDRCYSCLSVSLTFVLRFYYYSHGIPIALREKTWKNHRSWIRKIR